MAQEFLLAMSRLRANESLKLKDAVIVTKAPDGGVKVTETIDPTPGRSALSGAMWTGLLGLIVGGPVGWLAGIGIGAGAGAVTAKFVDLGIPDEWVDWFKQAVRPGTSAVIILAEEVDVRALQHEAERFPGAELIESTLPDAVITDLAAAFEARADQVGDERPIVTRRSSPAEHGPDAVAQRRTFGTTRIDAPVDNAAAIQRSTYRSSPGVPSSWTISVSTRPAVTASSTSPTNPGWSPSTRELAGSRRGHRPRRCRRSDGPPRRRSRWDRRRAAKRPTSVPLRATSPPSCEPGPVRRRRSNGHAHGWRAVGPRRLHRRRSPPTCSARCWKRRCDQPPAWPRWMYSVSPSTTPVASTSPPSNAVRFAPARSASTTTWAIVR